MKDINKIINTDGIVCNSLTMGYGSTIQCLDMRDPLPIKAVERYGLYNRWKPNGITDNRQEYYNKMRAIHNIENDCSIGLDDRPDLCSAGTCSICKMLNS